MRLENGGDTMYTVTTTATVVFEILPSVTLGVYDSTCEENPQNTGWFRLWRTGYLPSALTVNVTRSGSATHSPSAPDYYFSSTGSNFSSSDGTTWSVTFPAYEDEVYIVVNPYDDASWPPDQGETVILHVQSSATNHGVTTSDEIIIVE